jgi:DNA-binding SARP family transcriptional activator
VQSVKVSVHPAMTGDLNHIRLQTFGSSSLLRMAAGGAESVLLDVSKLLALVTYLGAAPRRSATRDHLTDLLWANLEPDAARHALRHARWQIHQKCHGLISIEGDATLTLETQIPWDRDDFLAAAEQGDVLAAVQHYRGDFFPSFASPGSGEFEHWTDVERTRLRSIFVRCGEAVVRQWLSHGRARDAVSIARRIRDTDRLHLTGWRLLLESLIASRDTLAAAVEADALERLIAENDIDPEPSVRSLLSIVRRQHAAHDAPALPISPLANLEMVGREREFAALIQAWSLATQGSPSCVIVTAPAGMGKTRLLHEFAARLQSLHARHVNVRASHASRELDFGVVSDLVARLGTLSGARAVSTETACALVGLNSALAAQFPTVHGRAPGRLEPVSVRNALRELLEAVAFEKPVAILLDDLHWCDAASRQVLAGAFSGLERKSVLMVATDRYADRRSDFLSSAHALPLAPLGAEAVVTLLGSVATVANEPWVATLTADLARYTDGSPLLIIEVLQLALERGALDLTDGSWRVQDHATLATLLHGGSALRERVHQLASTQRQALQALSIADAGLDTETLAKVVQRNQSELRRDLEEMELEGFITLKAERWALSHQECGTAASADLDEATLRALQAATGRALAEAASDLTTRRRAAAHLRRGSDWESLGYLLLQDVERTAHSQHRRSARAIAADLLGASASRDEVDRVMSSLPLLMRVGIVTRRPRLVAASVTVFLIAGTFGAALALRGPPAEPGLFATVGETQPNGDTWLWEIPVEPGGEHEALAPGRLLAHAKHAATLRGSISDVIPVHSREPNWIIERVSPDSGEVDLYLRGVSGVERRLTAAPGDDVHPDQSPDARYVAYATAATHPLQHTDIAVVDVSTAKMRLVTSGDASDRRPRWSPSGTRLAFLRHHFDRRPVDICLTALDARQPACITFPRPDVKPTDLRWISEDQLEIAALGYGIAFRLDLRTGKVIQQPKTINVGDAAFAPGGTWRLCVCSTAAAPTADRFLQLHRLNTDSQYVPADHDSSKRVVRLFRFRSEVAPDNYLDRLTTIGDTAFAILGIPFTVAVGGFDLAGRPVDVHGLTYQSSDTTVATIDSTGVAEPRSQGVTTIAISAGGWRTTSMLLQVIPNDTGVVLEETWRSGITTQWRPFGVPLPTTVESAVGAAFANSGDGRHTSGAYITAPFDAARGLAAVARVSTPVTLTQWQEQAIELLDNFDLSALERWDHTTANIWQDGRMPPSPNARNCRMRFPGGLEGREYANVVNTVSPSSTPPQLLKRLATGAWFEVTLQIFPDGRCGVAIDGTPVSLGEPASSIRKPYLLLLYGSSYDTKILVGPLRVMRGVRPGIGWDAFQRANPKIEP